MSELVVGMPECVICLRKYDTEVCVFFLLLFELLDSSTSKKKQKKKKKNQEVIPRTFPKCGHCLCEDCLGDLLKSIKKKKHVVKCPNCRVPVGKTRLDMFPKNWVLMETLEVVRKAEELDKKDVFDIKAFGFDALHSSEEPSLGESSSPGAASDSVPSECWACPACTLHNYRYDDNCAVCNAPKPKQSSCQIVKRKSSDSSTDKRTKVDSIITFEEKKVTADPTSFLNRISQTYGV